MQFPVPFSGLVDGPVQDSVVITIQQPSLSSLLVMQRAQANVIGTATGFVVAHGATKYLVTNWHVVTGRHPDNGVNLFKSGAWPDEVVIVHNAATMGLWVERTQPLYDTDGPLWLEHPAYGHAVDVVALPLTALDGVTTYDYDPWSPGPPLAYGPSRTVNIIGFPFGLTGGGALAIWVGGSVATEPGINFNDRPCFLVDSRTRSGQSGSPVIVYASGGTAVMEDGSINMFAGGPPPQRLLGVYSGRVNEQSDLGFVWRIEVVREIVERAKRGTADTPVQ